jgi:hypothetical protein
VCVFAKPPRSGEAKTRLARALGAAGAARLAQAFLVDVWRTVSALPWARPVLAGTSADVEAYGLGSDVELWLQGEGDLGARMERVLHRGLREAPQAIVLGADVPGLPASHLDEALAALAHADVVLGPSEDGGFHLLGARRLVPGALAGLTWSTPATRVDTRARLAATGHLVAECAPWFDIDVPEDLAGLARWLDAHRGRAPHTAAALQR